MNLTSTLGFIRQKIHGNDQYARNIRWAVGHLLDGSITSNYRTKTLICRLSAMLDEDYTTREHQGRRDIVNKLFKDDFDVEHIQSAKDADLINRPAIAKEWENESDTIGNLVALEQKINRGIGNKRFLLKRPAYQKSKYVSIQLILDQYTDWTKEGCKERQRKEKEKILNYIFGD